MRYIVWSLVLSFSLGATFAGAQERSQGIKVYDKREIIYVSNEDGSDERELTDGYDPSLSPNQQHIAFGRLSSLYVLDLQTLEEKLLLHYKDERLLDPGSRSVSEPKWSPNGKLIFFDMISTFFVDLYAINADGSNPQLITKQGGLASRSWPSAFSPDGRKVLYTDCFDECFTLLVFDLDTGQSSKLSNRTAEGAWSPDGRRVAFSDVYDGGLFVADLVEGQTTDLLEGTPLREEDFLVGPISWSMDSRKIAFSKVDSEGREVKGIYEIEMDRTGLMQRDAHYPAWKYDATLPSVIDRSSWAQVKKEIR